MAGVVAGIAAATGGGAAAASSGGKVTLTPAQMAELTAKVNAAGQAASPPYVYEGHVASQTTLGVVVHDAGGSGRQVAGSTHEGNNWESNPQKYDTAIEHVITAINAIW
jgi:hypothetical protein